MAVDDGLVPRQTCRQQQYSQYGEEPEDVAQAIEEAVHNLGGPGTLTEQQEFAVGYPAAAAQCLAQHRAA